VLGEFPALIFRVGDDGLPQAALTSSTNTRVIDEVCPKRLPANSGMMTAPSRSSST
jgi:hypothetical protein